MVTLWTAGFSSVWIDGATGQKCHDNPYAPKLKPRETKPRDTLPLETRQSKHAFTSIYQSSYGDPLWRSLKGHSRTTGDLSGRPQEPLCSTPRRLGRTTYEEAYCTPFSPRESYDPRRDSVRKKKRVDGGGAAEAGW
jgi:hypothetical protein